MKVRVNAYLIATALAIAPSEPEVQAAHAVARTKTYLAAQYRRLATHRGKKRAILVAVAHSILVIAYHLIVR